MQLQNILKIDEHVLDTMGEAFDAISARGKFLYVSDPVVDELYGQTVRETIAARGKLKEEQIAENTIAYAMMLAERVIATDVDYIVGLGGGRVLDTCKYAAYISKRPFIAIPTTISNDGIASPIAVLKRKDGKPKSLGCKIPSVILLDTAVIQQGPLTLIRAGIGDTISNYMSLLDWDYACREGRDEMNGFARLMSQTSLDALMKTQYNTICPEFIKVLANSIVMSGLAMDFAGSSRPVSGSEHLFSHALDYYCEKKNLHGIQVALGTLSMLKLVGIPYQNVLEYLNRFGVCVNPATLGIDRDSFVLCLQRAGEMRPNRYTYLNNANLEDENLTRIYHELVEELP